MAETTIDCGDIEGVASRLFLAEIPPPENSIQFELHPQDVAGDQPDHALFCVLGQILTAGLVCRYGADVQVSALDAHQLRHARACLRSLGYDVWFNDDIEREARTSAGQYLPWVLQVRDAPHSPRFHRVVFARLPNKIMHGCQ